MVKHEFFVSRARELRKSMTSAEILLWYKIRNRNLGYRFTRQYIFDDRYIVDFYCPEKRLVIEVDGGQHNENPADEIRDDYMQSKGCMVLRLWNNEVLQNLDGCLQKIMEVLRNE